MNTNRNSAYPSNNRDNFANFSLGLDFLNEAGKEQNTPSRFASLSESEMDKILKERQSNKTKQVTNWSISAFKGKLKFFRFKLLKIYLQLFLEIAKLTEKLSSKVINTFNITST